ncbi:PTS system N-acetylgalactosamine-specific IIA component [Mobilisporobacter senegalensis]|uniref:PTS system N-acetylgalactosamine-specific IIA component n=1 Tax=Mobilisporobacter senegalensis TaxID=1329262 RepID=A0A3N1X5V9_9FIRM|nr:hypothetical protein [Mobilisporobacter senegalensis]ROR22164.1 PTS system N-acetylgalactosamine-specific IIA component [Mobilisporobacter senegalensis]
MKQILLVSHGYMAYGTHEAAKMIIGDIDYLDHLCLSADKDVEVFKNEIREKLIKINDAKQIIVLADLLGGSPYTTTLALLDELNLTEKSFVVAGMNLSLIIQVALMENSLTEAELKSIIEESKSSMVMFEQNNNDDDDEL